MIAGGAWKTARIRLMSTSVAARLARKVAESLAGGYSTVAMGDT